MPVVIHPRDFSRWLDCVNHEPRDVADLMRSPAAGLFEAVPVSDRVNKVTNMGADLLRRTQPAEGASRKGEPRSTGQLELF